MLGNAGEASNLSSEATATCDTGSGNDHGHTNTTLLGVLLSIFQRHGVRSEEDGSGLDQFLARGAGIIGLF